MSNHKQSVIMYYDGECWMCQRYARYVALFQNYDMQLRNARDYLQEMEEYAQQGYDINQGMIVVYQDQVYHGADALVQIHALMHTQTKHIESTRYHRFCYRLINQIRKLLLLIKGSSKIMKKHGQKE